MAGKFSEAAIADLKHWAIIKGIGHYRRTCPECSHDRAKRHVECITVDIDYEYAKVHCHHCERGAVIRVLADPEMKPWTPPVKPKTDKPKAIKELGNGLDAMTRTFLKSRCISDTTAAMYGLVYARAYFLQIKREAAGLAYPYFEGTKIVGHKVRCVEEKDHVCQPALYTLFGTQNVDMKESTDFIITEGELDAMSFYEAGIINATSVPNGASSFTRQATDDTKAIYGFLWPSKALIDKAKRVLIAVDTDEAGNKLSDELARRVGKHRCWRITYPDDCKDANDVLMKHGPKRLQKCVDDAEPWPIEGIYEASKFFPEVFNLYDNGFGDRVPTGLSTVDELYSVGEGLLTIVTGIPANGKSTFVDQLMVNLARTKGYICGICSFENPPYVHIAKLAEMLMQKHFFDTTLPGDKMSRAELAQVQEFITHHFKFLQQDDGRKATLESIIERIKTAVFRWGIKCAVIDPYNYIQRPKTANSETEWIDDMLTQLRLLAAAHGLHIWFVAHPTKLMQDAEGNYPIPRGYSISGSGAWYSKADFGLTVHKVPDVPGLVKIINWKTRFDWLGKEGEANLVYDNTKNVYIIDAYRDVEPFKGSYRRYNDDDE